MKKLLLFLPIIVLMIQSIAQAPQKMSFQAVIRKSNNGLVMMQPISMRISILQGTANGNIVYQETHKPITNSNGLVTLEIGTGTIVTGVFSNIDWGNGPFYIKTETDPFCGTDYTIVGVSEFLSVPYALFSLNSVGLRGPQGLIGLTGATGSQGVIGLTGSQGLIGSIGATGATGIQGTNGLTGATGSQGLIGLNGLTGATGIQGANGLTGATGLKGLTGATGATGFQGFVGLTGAPGTDGKSAYDVAVVNGFVGTQIEFIASLKGAAGNIGITGLQGNTGASGIQGNIGLTGLTGTQGLTGTTGSQGIQGNTGAAGGTGSSGVPGIDGKSEYDVAVVNGFIGTQIEFIASLKGATGNSGTQGVIGNTGLQGNTGASGIQGNIGLTGSTGANGTNGLDGATGLIGLTGAAGPQGTQGIQGAQGITGSNGATGTNGATGLTGPTGLPGSDASISMTAIAVGSNANAATITLGALSLTPADGTNGGIVTNGTQTFAGAKTFTITPTALTAAVGTNTTQLATTEFVMQNNSPKQFSIAAGDEISTTSTSYVVAGDMALPPGAGKYFVSFNSQYTLPLASLTGSVSDLSLLYTDLMAKTNTNTHGVSFGNEIPIVPGVYTITGASTVVSNIILDGQKQANPEFVFKFSAAFSTAANITISYINGASACNVYWIAEGAITLGAGTIIKGTMLSNNGSVTAGSLSNVEGRMYSKNGALALNATTLYLPTGCTSSTNYGSVNSFAAFTSSGDVNNVGLSVITGDIGTNLGSIINFNLATINGIYYTPSTLSNPSASFSVFQNGVLIPFSTRTRINTLNLSEVSLTAIATVGDSQTIDIRWRIDAGTIKFQNRILTLIAVK